MKSLNKKTAGKFKTALIAALLASAAFTSCTANSKTASVAFADSTPSVSIPEDALAVTQALQTTFRSISSQVLPAVVEVDVTETQTVNTYNPFEGLPFFFDIPGFGNSQGGTREYETQGLGSGFIVRHIGNKYYVLTNNHVAGSATKITIKLNDQREFTGTLVGTDERMDIALVSFESNDDTIAIATLGNSDSVQTGDICLALGSPMGYFASVTQGIVSATGRSGTDIGSISDFIQTDAAINQGNSGGPLVNIYGEVIGINTWIVSQSGGSQGLGFSIPINNVKTAIDQFITHGKIVYGWLGVQLTTADSSLKESLGIADSQNGALTCEVFMGSPASKCGLLPGDFIVALDGHDIKSTDQLVLEVGQIPAGQTSTFTVIRNGTKQDISVTIEARDESTTNDNSKLWPGFVPQPLTTRIKDSLGIKGNIKGVVVTSVQSKSPAAVLRLQSGDIITAVNGKSVENLKEFYNEMAASYGTEIWFDVYSDGHNLTTSHYKFTK